MKGGKHDRQSLLQGLDFFGGQPLKGEKLVKALEWEANHEDDRIILLSDMWLDKAETLVQLDVILSGKFTNLSITQLLISQSFFAK